MRIEIYRKHGPVFTQFGILNGEPPYGIYVVRRAAFTNSRNHKAWSSVARNSVQHVRSSSNKRKAAMGYRETEARRCAKVERHLLFFLIRMMGSTKCFTKNALKKLEPPREAAAMPCKLKTMKRPFKQREIDIESNGSKKIQKIKACMHRGSSWFYEKAFGKGLDRKITKITLRTSRSYAPSDENPGCKSSSGQRMREARKVASVANDQSDEQKGGHPGSTKRAKNSPFCCADGHAQLEPKFQKYKGPLVFRGDIMKDDSGSHAVVTERGSSACITMTAAEVKKAIARLPDCTGRAADAVSA